jgi:wyosine [tRNA(Phe)-imidazoG37] synthetase (radical SAM superfamily)
MKTCGFSCVFCQLGNAECTTVTRREYVPTQEVLAELQHWLATDESADYVTLGGSGEPTLHSAFGDIFDFLREHSAIQTLLLSNGSLFFLPEVRESAMKADVVKVSVSAWDQGSFELVNRPHPDLVFEDVLSGLRSFRKAFGGRLLVEVVLLDGLNSERGDVEKIAHLVEDIAPDAIHLNTTMRPPADLSARPVSREHLDGMTALFTPTAEVISNFVAGPASRGNAALTGEHVLALLRRHPSTFAQLATIFGVTEDAMNEHLRDLSADHLVETTIDRDQTYYCAI